MSITPDNSTALAVDLDGTLIRGDLFISAVLALLRKNPLLVVLMPFWLINGRAALKRQVALRVQMDPSELDYRQEVLRYIRQQQDLGRRTVLATGSDEKLVQPVAQYLGCFDEVIASDGESNFTGRGKSRALVQRFGQGGYDYIGNANVDIPVWESASAVLMVKGSSGFNRRIEKMFEVSRVFH